jgi:intracellular sulfur oxidation DsrE/DsrF family protein
MAICSSRRSALFGFGSLVVGASAYAADRAHAATDHTVTAPGARKLAELVEQLRRSPRRRDFKTVPMIVQEPDFWDDEALRHVIAYQGNRKQVWDNTQIAGPWLNLMRNALNAQIFAFDHADYLAVSATHGTAHLALFDQSTWDKYELAAFSDIKFRTNTLIAPNTAPSGFSEFENPASVFGKGGNTITALQERGVVFLACHNAIWEIAARLIDSSRNPDQKSHEALAAELTNHLVEGVVLTPGITATILELQQAGFHYAA